MTPHIRRLDALINKIIDIRHTVQDNLEIEFDIDNLLAAVEVTSTTLADEIHAELEED